MEKIKNFVYDKSDILVTLVIIAIAAAIIWFGINNIMKPYEIEAQAQPTTTEEDTATPSAATPVTTPPATTATGVVTPTGQGIAANNNKGEPVSAKAAKIIIQSGETSDQIWDKLVAAGAIKNKNTFISTLEKLNIVNKVQLGTFQIPAGATVEDVCRIITKTS
jgi:cell division protein YceG involved in septum cleavage